MAAASAPAAPAPAASVVASSTSPSPSAPQRSPHARAVSFRRARKPKLPLFSSKVLGRSFPTRSCALVVRSQPSEAAGDSLKDSVVVDRKPEALAEPPAKETTAAPGHEGDMSEFMTQIASLVKLVDSRDIVELQLKQQDFELVVRKKEALSQPPPSAPVVMMQPHGSAPVMQPQFMPPPPSASALPALAGAGVLLASPPPPAPAAKSAKLSLPPLKSPMAGTFYGSPGPGQPPFVKVGDKVNKGQVLCIIEAMKLMNEIEADQAGTVIEILVDDAKPVGIDQPLFVIEP